MSKFNSTIITLILFLLFSSVFYLSVNKKQHYVIKQKIIQIEKQIALDLPLLDLSNELLKHSGNKDAVRSYINKLNSVLIDASVSLEHIVPGNGLSIKLEPNQHIDYLRTNNGRVLLVFNINSNFITLSNMAFCLMLFILSISLSMWLKLILANNNKDLKAIELNKPIVELAPFMLIIDLNHKTLSTNYAHEQLTSLANKPLCFYLALVEFCGENNDIALNQNKNVPEELVELANKYFHRLVELGHTVRKRPNFNNSLEKTLSEIRAALDEVLSEYPEQKEIYYPPKAFGEGSRSRLHSYGLVNIDKGNIDIKGK
ncbi:hypothetical protein [Pseudoalteromonas sp. TB64]|uniref:hypothetical protein n=1 Tax=Pseudoalteromonas sp. TB64 TaxID=1938600 RepID=UPI000418CB65|nr:hypothetical protein [Pseudoalteromonas sp. TB64]